ncbi:MAG: OmpA family protein [Saprospiraceae bacterium]|nr:OmpA family protein [Saprospiraceae bacterium]
MLLSISFQIFGIMFRRHHTKNINSRTQNGYSKFKPSKMSLYAPNHFNCTILINLLFSLGLFLIAIPLQAQNEKLTISGYEGSNLIGQYQSNYVQYLIAEGPLSYGEFPKKSTPEGALECFLYKGPSGRTALEVFRNYEQQLKKSGLSILFSCSDRSCNDGGFQNFFITIYGSENNKVESRSTFPSKEITKIYSGKYYLSAVLKGTESNKYVTIGVADVDNTIYTYIDILTEKSMDADMVKITAEYIKNQIKAEGKVVIYEALFETGKSTLLPSATGIIDEMFSYIKANPTKNFYIVGHTDDTGDFDANMTLSIQRAQKIADELIKKGVSARQITAKGVGPLAPIRTNQTDEGKQRNRRVELVERLK